MAHRGGGAGNRYLFLDKLLVDDGCWIWTARRNALGYGTVKFNVAPPHEAPEWRTLLAHRAAWMLFRGEIPEGMLVCHHCDNPACIRPDHLYLGTNADNAADRDAKGRQGKKLTREQAYAVRASTARTGEIARSFGITKGMVWLIKTGKAWQ